MTRVARRHQLLETLVYHVLSRGNGRMTVFRDNTDFLRFKDTLATYKKEYDAKVYHWVLMSNHFHIVIELPRPEDLSNLMARWLGGYSRYYSKRHDYPGHVWQERFKSQPIQKEMYLLKCGRYVERNPYRAHIAEKPWDYEWSSCRYYVNGFNDNLTDEDLFYRGMGINPEERRKFYMNWLMEGEDTGFKGAMSCSGDKQFTSRLRYYKGRLIAKRKGMSPR